MLSILTQIGRRRYRDALARARTLVKASRKGVHATPSHRRRQGWHDQQRGQRSQRAELDRHPVGGVPIRDLSVLRRLFGRVAASRPRPVPPRVRSPWRRRGSRACRSGTGSTRPSAGPADGDGDPEPPVGRGADGHYARRLLQYLGVDVRLPSVRGPPLGGQSYTNGTSPPSFRSSPHAKRNRCSPPGRGLHKVHNFSGQCTRSRKPE